MRLHRRPFISIACLIVGLVLAACDSSGSSELNYGVLDTSFGEEGVVMSHAAAGGNGMEEGYSIVLDDSGNIYVSGTSANASGDYDMVVWKYDRSGNPVTDFGTNGIVVDQKEGGTSQYAVAEGGYAVVLDGVGHIYVAGGAKNTSGDNDMVLWKYDTDGNPVASFGNNGIVVSHGAAGGADVDEGLSLALDSLGNIYVAGYSMNSAGDEDMVIWKFDSNGSPVESFGSNGVVVEGNTAGGSGADQAFSIVLDSADNLYVTGLSINPSNQSDMVIWKYDSFGNPVTSFGTNGIVLDHGVAQGSQRDYGHFIALDGRGALYVLGASINSSGDADMVLWKYDTDGNPITTFGSEGFVLENSVAGGSSHEYGHSLAFDRLGYVYVTGYSLNANGDFDMVLLKYNSDGARVTSFGNDGVVLDHDSAGGAGHEGGYSVAVDYEGKIYVSGGSLNANGDYDMVIWKYQ